MSNYIIEQRQMGIPQKKLTTSSLVIAHESGNPDNTGSHSLENEIAYMVRTAKSGGAFTSHWVGGGGRIIQIAKTGWLQYGAGPKANEHAFANVELARTNSSATFKKDYAAYIWLLKRLAREANIPCRLNEGATIQSKGIKTHHWVTKNLGGTTHTDPDDYLNSFGISLTQFAADLLNGISEMPASVAANEQIRSQKIHRVVKGDTLWSLARKYNTTVTWLKTLNQLSSDTIYTGQELLITGESYDKAESSRKTIIKSIQKTVGTVQDGKFGPKTKKAVIQLLQRDRGVRADGIWGPVTSAGCRTISQSINGWDVYAVQSMLIYHGFDSAGVPDKHAGPKTIQAIREFQSSHQLTVDGRAGPQTLGKLFG